MPARRRRPAAAAGPSYLGHCGDCGEEVLFLLNNRTQKFAPIHQYPEPGGNIMVNLAARTYRVIPPEELHLFDVTIAIHPDRHPNLHVHHTVNCPFQIRRRARAAQQATLPLEVEGAAVSGGKHFGRPRCSGCGSPLSIAELAAGATTCTTC